MSRAAAESCAEVISLHSDNGTDSSRQSFARAGRAVLVELRVDDKGFFEIVFSEEIINALAYLLRIGF